MIHEIPVRKDLLKLDRRGKMMRRCTVCGKRRDCRPLQPAGRIVCAACVLHAYLAAISARSIRSQTH